MRARRKKHTPERLAACAEVLCAEPEAQRGAWRALFASRDAGLSERSPLMLELGCGKGDFATGYVQSHPEAAFCALERVPDVLVIAAEKAVTLPSRNLLLLSEDAHRLTELFAPHEVDGLFLNFSDPWPKKRNAKRRLTAPGFLEIYRQILKPGASIVFKTDNVPLFEYSLASFEAAGFALLGLTRDLHHSPLSEGNIQTEYEKAFSAAGMPICRVEAKLP